MRRYMNLVVFILALAVCLGRSFAATDEFVGPFPSWANAKRDYGAVGDGRADDTAALQKAFDDLGTDGKPCALYLPAGTYRITKTLVMAKRIGLCIYGEDPTTTIIRWDGQREGTMAWFNGVAYSAFGRITWDGAGKALAAVDHGWEGKQPNACTHNEHADEVFKDVGFGIRGGSRGYMDAETAVLRCRFLRCSKAGISIENFNALDWFIWHGLFEDCHIGVTNTFGAGNFCIYESVFRRSKAADIAIGNLCYFSVRDSYSIGSKAFFTGTAFSAGALITIQGNTVVDPQDAAAISIANLGPVMLIDNVILSRQEVEKGPVVRIGHANSKADLFAIGNKFTVLEPMKCFGRLTGVDNQTVARQSLQVAEPKLPGFLKKINRQVFEVPPGADAGAIQAAIEKAAALKGQRPVVHLPQGRYRVDRTIVVPPDCDVQLVGDALIYRTLLQWAGKGAGPILRLDGPSRTSLLHLHLRGNKEADGLLVANCDQPGSRVTVEGASVPSAHEVGVLIDGVENADVSMYDFYHAGAPVSFKVVGGPRQAKGLQTPGRVCVFSGATSNNQLTWHVENGGRVLAQDLWYETGKWPRFIHLAGSGELYYQSGMIAVSSKKDVRAAIELDDFHGRFAMLGAIIHSVSPINMNVLFRGQGRDMKALVLGCQSNDAPKDQSDKFFLMSSPSARVLLLHNRRMDKTGATHQVPDEGVADPNFLREMLLYIRTQRPRPAAALPAGVTDAYIHRLFIEGARVGLHLR